MSMIEIMKTSKQKRSKKIISALFISFLLISCNNSSKNKKECHTISELKTVKDSVVVYYDESNNPTCIYDFLNNTTKIKEYICLLPNGDIDYNNSYFLKIKGNDLYYYSPYSMKKSYRTGENRFIVFKGNDSIEKDFGNIKNIKLKEFNFNENDVILNFRERIAKIGVIEETIFIDTITNSNEGNKKIIRTIELLIDTDNLLINKIEMENN